MKPEIAAAVKERRFETLAVSLSSMPQFLAGNLRVVNGVPEDAYVYRVFTDFPSDTLNLTLAHPSFKPVPLNQYPPHCNAQFLKTR